MPTIPGPKYILPSGRLFVAISDKPIKPRKQLNGRSILIYKGREHSTKPGASVQEDPCAIKVIIRDASQDHVPFLARCQHEATAPELARSALPSDIKDNFAPVVKIIDHGESPDQGGRGRSTYVIVMEWLEHSLGEPWADDEIWDEQTQRLYPSAAIKYMTELASSLSACHSFKDRPITHGDVSLGNVRIRKTGKISVAVLTDFEWARLGPPKQEPGHATLTRAGTPPYMAPEQFDQGRSNPSNAIDIYAIGVILHELLTGKFPFDPPYEQNALTELPPAIDHADILTWSKHHIASGLRTFVPDRAGWLSRICYHCMRKNPAERLSAEQVAEDLRNVLADIAPVHASPITSKMRRRDEEYYDQKLKRSRERAFWALFWTLTTVAMVLLLTPFGVRDIVLARRAAQAEEHLRIAAQINAALEEEKRKLAEINLTERYQYQHKLGTVLLPKMWTDGNHFEMPGVLAAMLPRSGEDDLRGFEWHYWKQLTDDLRQLKGHTDAIFALAISPGSHIVATGGQDRSIRLWNIRSGKLLHTLTSHKLPVTALSFSPDGLTLASVACDVKQPMEGSELKIWNVNNYQIKAETQARLHGLFAISYTSDGSQLVSGGGMLRGFGITAGAVMVWNPLTAQAIQMELTGSQPILCLAFTPDGSRLITGSSPGFNGAGELKLWDTSTWKVERSLGKHATGLWGAAFTPDGSRVVICGTGTDVRILNVKSGQEEMKLVGHKFVVRQVVVSLDGRYAATASFDGTIKIWSIESGKEVITFQDHSGFVNCVAFSHDGRQLITAGADAVVRVWDGTIGEQYVTEVSSRAADAAVVAFSPDGTQLAWTSRTSSGSGQVSVWDINAKKLVFSNQDAQVGYFDLSFRPDGQALAVGTGGPSSQAGGVRIWNLLTKERIVKRDGWHAPVGRIAYTKLGSAVKVISASWKGDITISDEKLETPDKVIQAHHLPVYALAVSSDGKFIASGGGNISTPSLRGELKVWDTISNKFLPSFNEYKVGVTALAFSPDSTHLAVAGFEEEVQIWNVQKANPLLKLGHFRMTTCLAYSADGTRLVTGSFDGTITIWDSQSGLKIMTLSTSKWPIVGLAFSPDGLRLASASGDGKIRLWDTTHP